MREGMRTRSSYSASADSVPLQVKFPTGHHRQGELPIVNRLRSSDARSNCHVDSYFIQPRTGKQFPSLESCDRQLNGGVYDRGLTRKKAIVKDNLRVYEGSKTTKQYRTCKSASKSFRLPKGWKVKAKQRDDSSQVDKYYVEPGTGKKFRSLVSIERYLEGTQECRDQKVKLIQCHRSKDFSLPDGWIVEEKQRRSSSHKDRCYIEPGTGHKFRSLAAVERYLESVKNDTVEPVALSMNRKNTGGQNHVFDPNPPKKVKWVLTGSGGNTFSAYMNGSDVSSSIKQKWSEAFVSLIQDRC